MIFANSYSLRSRRKNRLFGVSWDIKGSLLVTLMVVVTTGVVVSDSVAVLGVVEAPEIMFI